jgi:hypothetical protein
MILELENKDTKNSCNCIPHDQEARGKAKHTSLRHQRRLNQTFKGKSYNVRKKRIIMSETESTFDGINSITDLADVDY